MGDGICFKEHFAIDSQCIITLVTVPVNLILSKVSHPYAEHLDFLLWPPLAVRITSSSVKRVLMPPTHGQVQFVHAFTRKMRNTTGVVAYATLTCKVRCSGCMTCAIFFTTRRSHRLRSALLQVTGFVNIVIVQRKDTSVYPHFAKSITRLSFRICSLWWIFGCAVTSAGTHRSTVMDPGLRLQFLCIAFRERGRLWSNNPRWLHHNSRPGCSAIDSGMGGEIRSMAANHTR